MDIINRLHSTFKDCQYFEFGEDYVKFFDEGKMYQITVSECQPKEKKQLCAQTVMVSGNKITKSTKVTSKGKKKTWESILKEKNK